MRWFPAAVWLLVYVGSLFVLNGAHGKWDPLELALGFGLPLVGFCIAVWVAVRPWPGRPRPRGISWFLVGTFLFYVVTAVAALVGAGPDAAVATLLAFLIPGTAVAAWIATARTRTAGGEDGVTDATKDDGEDPFPGMGLEDGRPLGDSAELHDEITPHDLPKGHPARVGAEHQAGELGGTTPGHDEAHRGARVRR